MVVLQLLAAVFISVYRTCGSIVKCKSLWINASAKSINVKNTGPVTHTSEVPVTLAQSCCPALSALCPEKSPLWQLSHGVHLAVAGCGLLHLYFSTSPVAQSEIHTGLFVVWRLKIWLVFGKSHHSTGCKDSEIK